MSQVRVPVFSSGFVEICYAAGVEEFEVQINAVANPAHDAAGGCVDFRGGVDRHSKTLSGRFSGIVSAFSAVLFRLAGPLALCRRAGVSISVGTPEALAQCAG